MAPVMPPAASAKGERANVRRSMSVSFWSV